MFLFGLGGAAVLTVGGGLAWVSAGYTLAAGDVAVGCTAKELAIVRALVLTLVPADGELPDGVEIGLHQRIDEEIWAASDVIRDDLKAALSLVEHLPPLFGFWGRFTGLDAPSREAYLRALLLAGPDPIVQAVTGLRQICLFLYYTHPESWPAIGYEGPFVTKPVPPDSAIRYQELLQAARGGR